MDVVSLATLEVILRTAETRSFNGDGLTMLRVVAEDLPGLKLVHAAIVFVNGHDRIPPPDFR